MSSESPSLERVDPVEALFAGVDWRDPLVLLSYAESAVDKLQNVELDQLTDDERRLYNAGVERLRNRADATAIDAARALDEAGHEQATGYFTAAGWMRHRLQLSNAESRARMQVVRLLDALPQWQRAVHDGTVGVEQVRAAARTFALERVREAFVEQADSLLRDARTESLDRFEELLQNLRRLSDAERERRAAERRVEQRSLSMRQQPDGSWRLTGRFGDVQGAEINEILAHFFDGEWRVDWVDATEAAGAGGSDDGISVHDLARTEPQRRADALHQMIMAAAANPGDGKQPLPTLNVLFDDETLRIELEGGEHDPARYRHLVCRTQSGDQLPISEASSMALYAHLRRVVLGADSVVTDLGRRQRLFTGAAREAVMLMHPTCAWPGCDVPIRRCEADHAVEWGARSGTTCPSNGCPMCGRHNRLKHRNRYRVVRRPDGHVDITLPDGSPIV